MHRPQHGMSYHCQLGRVILPTRMGLVSLLLVVPLALLLIQLVLNREDQLTRVQRKLQSVQDIRALQPLLESAERLRDLSVVTVYEQDDKLQAEYGLQRQKLMTAIENLHSDGRFNRHNPLIEMTLPRLQTRLENVRAIVGTEVNTPGMAFNEHQPVVDTLQQLQFRLADQDGMFNDSNQLSLVLVYLALDESNEVFTLLGRARAYGSLYLRMGHVPSDGAVSLEQIYEQLVDQNTALHDRVSALLKEHPALKAVPPFSHPDWMNLAKIANYLDDNVIQSPDLTMPWRTFFDAISSHMVEFAGAQGQILNHLTSIYQQEQQQLVRQQRVYLGFMLLLILVVAVLYAVDMRETRIKENVRKEKDAAEAADQAKSQFLATMSHEIRTPINGVLGMVELLSGTSLNEEQQDYLAALRSSGQTLLAVINDVLDFSKIEAGKLQIEALVFDVRQILNESMALFVPQMKQKQLAFHYSVDKDVPALICTDPSRLRQILLNLVSNAMKFTEQGSVAVQLSAKMLNGQRYLYGVVRDTGIGMDESQQADLFKQFSQTDKTISRRYGGTGLGLAICQRLCQLMGGEIGVSSKRGTGSTFWFTLALQEVDASHLAGAENIAQEQRMQYYIQQFKGRRILVAEDNKVNQMVVQGMLKKAGLLVDVVDNGLRAVELICQQEEEYDWVLMDWEMPEMDGLTACKQIRAWEKKYDRKVTPIIALTAHVLSDYEQQAYAAGMQSFLKKPIDQGALFQSLLLTLSQTTEKQ